MNHRVDSESTPVIEVVSDVVCPWCYIGKRRLEKALVLLQREDVAVSWKPFELNPGAPKEGMDRQAYRIRKFGSLAYSQQLEARVAAAGAEEGIEFRFDEIKKTPNTFEAHRLIWLAAREQSAGMPDLQNRVVESLFRAYFIEALDVGDTEVLKRIAAESGLDRVEELLATRLGAEEVMGEESLARGRGVSGVPSFFIDGESITSGAQKAEVLAGMLGPALGRCSLEDGACR